MEKKEEQNCPSSAEIDDELQRLLQTLEQQTNWDGRRIIKYGGLWLPLRALRPILSIHKHFKPKNSDIILSTMPKSGTTWLKALVFSISNRHVCPIDGSPLFTSTPHMLVPFLEFGLYFEQENPDLEHIPSARIFSTHMPFQILPDSILESESRKIIYLCRNPLDQFGSDRHFLLEINMNEGAVAPLDIDQAFDLFCQGIHPFGPFWEHMLGYWNAHLENPGKVLFLKYEDLKEDISSHVKKMAEFIGFPVSPEEEKQGLIEQISRLCSFENLSNLEVNKTGSILDGTEKNSSFFRKGQIGDWLNYLTPAMGERLKKLMENKLHGSGLMFNTFTG